MASSGASDAGLDAWVANQPQLRQLAESIALSNGFQFDVVVSDDMRLSNAALGFIERTVLERRGAKCTIERLVAPGRDEFSRPPFDPLALVESVVRPLLVAPASAPTIWFVDTLGSRAPDEPAWRAVFRRLNENRNRIAEGLQSPLVVCVPTSLRSALIDEAPDLWSARSAVAVLDHERFLGRLELQTSSLPKYSADETQLAHPRLRSAREQVAAARARLQRSANDEGQLSLVVALEEAGHEEAAAGFTRAAIEAHNEALSILAGFGDRPDQAELVGRLTAIGARAKARHLRSIGESAAARLLLLGALDRLEQCLAHSPNSVSLLRACAGLYGDVGDLLLSLGEGELARKQLERSVEQFERVLTSEPDRTEYQRDLSTSYNKLAAMMRALGHGERAREFYERALEIRIRLTRAEPSRADYQRDLSVSYNRLGDLTESLGQGEQAREYFEKDLEIAEHLAKAEPDRADYQRDLAVSYNRLGDLTHALGKDEKAREFYERALKLIERLAQAESERADYQRDLATSYERLARIDDAQARALLTRAAEARTRLAQADPGRADLQLELARTLAQLAIASGSQGVESANRALTITLGLRDDGRLSPADAGIVMRLEQLRDELTKGRPQAGA